MADDWATAFRSQYVDLVRVCTLLAGDQALAEDAVVNAFTRIFGRSRRSRRAEVANPGAYLRVAAINETRRLLQCNDRRARREVRAAARDPAALGVPTASPVEERDRLRRALDGLTHQQRTVVVLRHVLDLPESEVASTLGIPVGTVKSLNHRGLAALRRGLTTSVGDCDD